MGRWIALIVALAGALLLGWQGVKSPNPLGLDAPPEAFSAARALPDIGAIAGEAHPTGSPANAAARDHLIARMTALGLSPQVQRAPVVESLDRQGEPFVIGATIENIVGVLPGKDRGKPALGVMAHYDSVPASAGAADDATGVAAALEIARALKVKGQPERDVIFIMSDGEEIALLGARAFFAEHPLRKRVGLLINMEARGNGGRANMFQTGPGNGELIGTFARSASKPVSSSLAVFLYENMPNDTDFTVSKAAGVPGLNFAFIGRQFDYHMPTATVANLDIGSVQHIGDQALAAASAFAFAAELPARSGDAIYSQTFGDHILAYPAWGGWIVLLLAGGLLVWSAARARRSGLLNLPDSARGAGAALTALLAGALLLHVARRATGVEFGFIEQRPLLAQWALWETTLAVLAVGLMLLLPALLARGGRHRHLAAGAVMIGAISSMFGGFDPLGLGLGVATAVLAVVSLGRAVAHPSAWFGALCTGLFAAVALQVAVPAMAVLVAWPLTLAAAAAAVTVLGSRMELARSAVVAVIAAIGGGWLAGYFHGVAQGLDMPMILGLFVWLGALLFWPLAPHAGPRGLYPALVVLGAGAVLLLTVRFNDPWTARHPRLSNVYQVTDAQSRGWRIALPYALDDWSRSAVTVEGGKPTLRDGFAPLTSRKVWTAPAEPTGMARPDIRSATAPDGRVTVTIPNLPEGRLLVVDLKSATRIGGVTVNGRPAPTLLARPGSGGRVRWQGGGTLEIAFKPAEPGSLELSYAAVTSAGARPWPTRPATVMPFDNSDSVAVLGKATARW